MSVGRFEGEDAIAIIVRAPLMTPEPPIPATARPTMSILLEVAKAQTNDPSSNTATKHKKEYFRLK
jgi:hypothetical protein